MLFAVPAGGGRKPAQASSDTDVLNAESKKFVDYARDFLAMETAYVDERLDSDIAGTLYEVANHNTERSGLLGSLVSVYEGTDCSKRHGEYQALVDTEILTASKQVDLDIKAVQLGITDTAKPGLAAEALRMKNELQGLKEKLEQIAKSLEQEQTATHQPGGPSWNALSGTDQKLYLSGFVQGKGSVETSLRRSQAHGSVLRYFSTSLPQTVALVNSA